MEEKSGDRPENILTSPADVQMDSVEVRRKHGHPVKRKNTEAEKDEHPSGLVAGGKSEQSDTMVPLQADVNHKNGGIFETDNGKGPKIHDLPQNKISGPRGVANGEPANSTPVHIKKKRGRPRKITVFNDNVVNSCEPDVSDADKDSGPARRLRSRREQHPTTSDGNVTAPTSLHAKNTNEANQRGFKRRGKLPDQQNLAKLSKLGVSRDVSSVVSSDTGAEGRVEAGMMGKLNTIKQETDVNRQGQSISRPGEGQRTTVRQVALGHRRLLPKPPVTPAQCQPSLSPRASGEPEATQLLNASKQSQSLIDAVPPQTRDPSNSSVRSSERDGNSSRTDDILSNVKDEDIEIELDNFNSMSQSNSLVSSQYHANTTVKSECPSWNYEDNESQIPLTNPIDKRRRNVKKCNEQGESKPPKRRRSLFGYRRSKQEKRRRPLLQEEPVSVPKKQERKSANKAPKTRDSGDSDNQEGNSNDSSTKGREKVLLKCKDCGRAFKFLSQYIIHRRIHTGERPYKCNECGKSFSKNSNLNLHLKTHKNYNLASPEYPSHMKMHSHMPKQDPEEEKPDKLRRRDEHSSKQVSHTPVSVRKNGKPTCQYCGKQFPFQSALVRHVRVHTGEKPYKCDICGRGFGQAYFLRVHELTHWSVKRYNCTLCGKSFTHYSNAKNHPCRFLKDNQGSQPKKRFKPSLSYTCHICKNTYYQLQDFNSHMKDHTGAKLYRCLFCDKLFGVLSEFNVHRNQCVRARGEGDVATYEGRRGTFELSLPRNRRNSSGQIAAPVVPSVSETQRVTSHQSSESPQNRHMKPSKKPFQSTVVSPEHLSHLVSKLNKLDNRSDPRKYLCPSCGRLFRHMGRLRAHMLTHARGQSYTCGCCGKTLENWKKLWRHQRIHRQRRGRFTCPQCGQGFRFVGPYKKHMTEHPEYQWIQGRPNKVSLPYQCEECNSSFKTLDLLFSHQLCHSSLQDTNKDSDYHVPLDAHSAHSNKNMFNPHVNSTTDFHPESHDTCYYAPLQMDPSPEVPVPSPAPPIPAVPLAQNLCLESWNTGTAVEQPSSTPLHPEGESTPSCDRIEENAFGMQARTLTSPKKQVTSGGMKLKECEGSSEDLKCAVCSSTCPTISDLYQHYLQHARGQL